jgi:murein DD-endopeptidase MepM/ murein hydrolase activator NlpD
MMRSLLFLFAFSFILSAAQVKYLRWPNNETYLQFLQKHDLPLKPLYYDLDDSDQQSIEEIRQGVHYQMLVDSNGTAEQVLIPISDELQVHITRTKKSATFKLIPIRYKVKQEGFVLTIKNSPYQDILEETHSKKLAQIFIDSFKKSIDFRHDIHKGDKIVMVYNQKYRFGHPFSMPELLAVELITGKRKHLVYQFEGRYYNEKGHQIQGFFFIRPVKGGWISSGFSLRRWQPILHIYRPHYGVDYAVVVGTPIHAAASGRVIFAGQLRGYGNVIKIRHSDGYMTLYAHQRRFRRGIHRGVHVKQGEVIGYVGVTGLTTGPHLHFGVYHYGRAINPLLVVQKKTRRLYGKEQHKFIAYRDKMNGMLAGYIKSKTPPPLIKPFQSVYYVNNNAAEATVMPHKQKASNPKIVL